MVQDAASLNFIRRISPVSNSSLMLDHSIEYLQDPKVRFQRFKTESILRGEKKSILIIIPAMSNLNYLLYCKVYKTSRL